MSLPTGARVGPYEILGTLGAGGMGEVFRATLADLIAQRRRAAFAVPSLGGDERLVLENAGFPVTLPNDDLLVLRVNADRQMQLPRVLAVDGTGRPAARPPRFQHER